MTTQYSVFIPAQLKKEIRNNIKDSNGNMSYVELITKEYSFDINFEEYRAFAVAECQKFLLNKTKNAVKKQIRKFVKSSGLVLATLDVK